jgi:glycosyltransferase involved in cell wall biosynthesis
MNILIIAKHLEPGGISSYVISLSRGLIKKGHNCFVVSSGGVLEGLLQECGAVSIKVDLDTKSELSPKVFSAIRKLSLFVKEKDIQIIHAQTRVASIIAWRLSRLNNVPFISTCHGFFRPRLFRKIFPCWGKKTIAISEEVFKHLINDFRLKKENIELIYNGLDMKNISKHSLEAQQEFKNKFNIGVGPVVGCVARLSEVKGHKFLIESFKTVLKEFPHAQLILVGEGRIKPDLAALAVKLGVAENVIFIPSVLETSLALSVMDIFVMPSIQEGLGLAIMEAMANGIPVVATNVGGIRNLIKNNETGILVSSGDSKALADGIISLLKNKEKANMLSFNAQDFVQREFSLEKMVNKTEALYKSLLNP